MRGPSRMSLASLAAGLILASFMAWVVGGDSGELASAAPGGTASEPVEAATLTGVVVPVGDVARWTGLLRAHGQARIVRRTPEGRELATLATVSCGELGARGKAEVRRQLRAVLQALDRELEQAQVEPETDLGRARRMATGVLSRKEIELALAALEAGQYTTGDARELLTRLPETCKTIECGAPLPSGERTRVALIIDRASDPDYAPIERMLGVVAETIVAQQVEAFNRQSTSLRRAAFERIEAARTAIADCRRASPDPARLAVLTAAWVRACAVLPHGRAEIDSGSFVMHLR